jgi:hypothetical protein
MVVGVHFAACLECALSGKRWWAGMPYLFCKRWFMCTLYAKTPSAHGGSNLLKNSYEAVDRVWTGNRTEHISRLRQTYPVLTQSTQRDKSNTSLIAFVLELREDIVPLLLVFLPNLCLLLTELHRLTLPCRLGLGLL